MRFVGVIPARFFSSRLEGKCLLEIAGKPMVQWVYEGALRSRLLSEVVVATDDDRILKAVDRFGGRALLTRRDHPSGTDRVAEAATQLDGDVFINIQGDEPLISPATIDGVCKPFQADPDLLISTACVAITERSQIETPHNVKVVTSKEGRALYFSRHPIPYQWDGEGLHYKHLGIYGYRRALLEMLPRLGPSRLEKAERLEQLRFLENGLEIQVVAVEEDSVGVDTKEDLERVRPLLENEASRLRKTVFPG